MNTLFVFASAADLAPQSNHAKLMEFWRLDDEIEKMQHTMGVKELFHSLQYAVLNVRAKEILRQLNLQK